MAASVDPQLLQKKFPMMELENARFSIKVKT